MAPLRARIYIHFSRTVVALPFADSFAHLIHSVKLPPSLQPDRATITAEITAPRGSRGPDNQPPENINPNPVRLFLHPNTGSGAPKINRRREKPSEPRSEREKILGRRGVREAPCRRMAISPAARPVDCAPVQAIGLVCLRIVVA